MAKNVQLAIRMTDEKRDALRHAAELSSRTMSSYIDFALTRALREDGYLQDKPQVTKGKPKG